MFSTTKNTDDMGQMTTFIGKRIIEFKSAKSLKKGDKHIYKFVVDWDDEGDDYATTYSNRLTEFLDSSATATAKGLVFGNWAPESGDSSEFIVKLLSSNAERLPEMLAMFVGEIGQEENELSWIQQTDMGPLLSAFPKLELLRTRGSDGLQFKKARHDNLRALGVESGGLPKSVVGQICKARFPNLQYLELWLGTENYGGNATISDLQPILKGKAFPNLTYLGLRNSEIADDIAGVIVNSPIIKQLETLDLSLGTLTDEGANALLSLPTDGKLKRLDVHHHFMSKAMAKKLKALPFTVNTADTQEPDDWGDGEMRFVAVGE
jgi:hypothetical protein